MKVLFISTSDVNRKFHGGELCTNRNYLSFCQLVGEENVTVINLMETIPTGFKNAIKKRINYSNGYYEGLSKEKAKEYFEIAKNHDLIFINSSTHGTFANYLKNKKYKGKIVSFFHNVEYNIQKDKIKSQPHKILELLCIKKNETNACKYSDKVIALNKRDAAELSKIYEINDIKIIPISLIDTAQNLTNTKTSIPPTFLFTGNKWYANVHGITWFIDNVLDHVDIKLQITGHRMDQLLERFEHPKIEFLGFVDSLDQIFKDADYVVLPIFIGSGMKVKTCEALMYGKNIIGTRESFEGYDIEPEKVGAICSTKEEFIEKINSITSQPRDKVNSVARQCFLNAYSFDATLNDFKEIIE